MKLTTVVIVAGQGGELTGVDHGVGGHRVYDRGDSVGSRERVSGRE